MQKKTSALLIFNILFLSFVAELSHNHFSNVVNDTSVTSDGIALRGHSLCIVCLATSSQFTPQIASSPVKANAISWTLVAPVELSLKTFNISFISKRAPPAVLF